MKTTNYSAKVTRPQTRGVVQRERLFNQLNQLAEVPVTWIMGPPGAGKTTLVTSYLEQRQPPTVWYQIDSGDTDIGSFFYYFTMAVTAFNPAAVQQVPKFTSDFVLGIDTFARNYFSAWFTSLPENSTIVFDNYQEVAADAPIQAVIKTFIELLPKGCRIFILSRANPPSLFARLRMNGDIAELGWEALRLTPQETREIVGKKNGQGVDVNTVYQLSDGWVAGLTLLLRQVSASGSNLVAFPNVASNEVLFEYFAGELFANTEANVQTFLVTTALLPDVSIAVAEELTGQTNAGQILQDLQRQHYFTDRLDNAAGSFRYHPLFRAFLLARAKQLFDQTSWTNIQLKAAQLLEREQRLEMAANLYQSIQDWEGLSGLIIRQAFRLQMEGRYQTLSEWLQTVPTPKIERNPWLLYWQGNALLFVNPGAAQLSFEQAYTLFEQMQDVVGLYLSVVGVQLVATFTQRDLTGLNYWIELVHRLESRFGFPAPEIEAMVTWGQLTSLVWRSPNHPRMQEWVQRAMKIWETTSDLSMKYKVGVALMYHFGLSGRVDQAKRMASEEIKASSLPSDRAFADVLSAMMSTFVFSFAGEYEAASRSCEKSLDAANASGIHLFDNLILAGGMYSTLVNGNLVQSDVLLNRLAQNIARMPLNLDTAAYELMRSWRLRWGGDFNEAVIAGRKASEVAERIGAIYPESLCRYGYALALYDNGSHTQAEDQLRQVREIASAINSQWMLYSSDLLEARFAFNRGDIECARACLSNAFQIQKEFGIGLPLLWRKPALGDLYADAIRNNIESSWVLSLLTRYQISASTPPLELDGWPWPIRIFTLGNFELYVSGQLVKFDGAKAQSKPLELLKAIIAQGGQHVMQEKLIDSVWPDSEGDAGRRTFDTNMHRLRKLLSHTDAVQIGEGKVSLDRRYCWCDVWAIERLCQAVEEALCHQSVTINIVQTMDRLLGLYKGSFLADNPEQTWLISLREKLNHRVLRAIDMAAQYAVKQGQFDTAIRWYEAGVLVQPLYEELYRKLMQVYLQLEQKSSALTIYERCQKILMAELGIKPSPEIEKLKIRAS